MNGNELLKFIRLVGLNPHLISILSNQPVNEVYTVILDLIHEHQIYVAPIINTEKLGLYKAVIWCKKSTIPYDKAKKLAGPLVNIFRGDIEDQMFMLVFYTNLQIFEEVKKTYEELFKKLNMDCSVNLSLHIMRFINDENCYDFDNKEWICNRKFTQISAPPRKFTPLDKEDVNLITSIQVNPAIPYWRNPHYKHIKGLLDGFIYTLGKINYIVDIKSRKIYNHYSLISAIQLDNGEYITEYHTDKKGLDQILNDNKDEEIIVAVKDLAFAHGFSIPYEVFKDNKWKLPKIKIE